MEAGCNEDSDIMLLVGYHCFAVHNQQKGTREKRASENVWQLRSRAGRKGGLRQPASP